MESDSKRKLREELEDMQYEMGEVRRIVEESNSILRKDRLFQRVKFFLFISFVLLSSIYGYNFYRTYTAELSNVLENFNMLSQNLENIIDSAQEIKENLGDIGGIFDAE